MAPEGRKVTSPKAAGAEPAGQMRDERLHAVVARSTFVSKKGKNTSRSDHSWKFRGRKSARRFGAKHISKSKCTKHTCSDHFWKFRGRKSARRLARSTFPSQIGKSTTCSDHFLTFRCRKKVHNAVARNTFPSQKCKQNCGF